jgi:RNA polymerase sigma factor for flagellar operon FliA
MTSVSGQEGGESSERALWNQFQSSRLHRDRKELVRMYEPFARSIAARMYGMRVDDSVAFEDYVQYGRVGLLEAVDRFDLAREVMFSAYAASRIRGAILNGIAKESELAAQNRFWRSRVRDRIDSLRTAAAPSADRASLAQIATITVGLALGVLLEDSPDSFEPADPNAQNNPYAANELSQLAATVRTLVHRLPEKERAVITGHYVNHLEFQHLAQELSLTKGRVSQLHAQALQRMRQWLEERPNLDHRL